MTNQYKATAGLPLFESQFNAENVDVDAILEQAKIMRMQALGNMLKNAFAGIKAAFRAQRTARTLDQLSDSVLADIGIERSQIASISQQLANGTYVPQTATPATVSVIGRSDADADVRHDANQPELPLAA